MSMATAGTLRGPAVRAADMRDASSGWRTSHGDDLGIRRGGQAVADRAPDGVCACALAFSTLLSSQGADAHHPRLFGLIRGNPTNLPVLQDVVKRLQRTRLASSHIAH